MVKTSTLTDTGIKTPISGRILDASQFSSTKRSKQDLMKIIALESGRNSVTNSSAVKCSPDKADQDLVATREVVDCYQIAQPTNTSDTQVMTHIKPKGPSPHKKAVFRIYRAKKLPAGDTNMPSE